MKLYVINLDRSPDRLKHINYLFQKQGLKFTRIAAIDANTMSDKIYQKSLMFSQWKYPLTKGEIGCFLSHRLAWEKIVKSKEPYAAIFEDDASISPNSHEFLSSHNWIPSDADIVKLETRKNRVHLGKAKKISESRNIAKLKSTHLLSAGYIISKKAAKWLLHESEKATMPIDHFMFNFGYKIAQSLSIYQIDPALVIQEEFPTTIVLQDNKKKLKLQKKIKREIRRFFLNIRAWINASIRFIVYREKWKRVSWK